MDRTSGYDPETDICWQFCNPGDNRWCKCPAHSAKHPDHKLVGFGRCRSGKRWFWTASTWVDLERQEDFGWTDSEEEAVAAAMTAVRNIRASCGKPVIATMVQGCASERLKELNEAKRAARPAPDTSEAHAVEYLYNCEGSKFQIIKKTKRHIYYSRNPLPFEDRSDDYSNIRDLTDRGVAFINRQKIERDGEIWSHKAGGWWEADCRLYLRPPSVTKETKPDPLVNLHRLKAEMAAAHPDRGGSNAAFIEARARYVAARRHLRSQQGRSL